MMIWRMVVFVVLVLIAGWNLVQWNRPGRPPEARDDPWRRAVLYLLMASILSGCSVGGHYAPEGPHPHVVVAGALHQGPLELLHVAASNAKPVTDLTVLTMNVGPHWGRFQPTLGAGFQASRLWGACDSTGHNCEKTWEHGWVAAAGVTYTYGKFRADLRGYSYDNSPVGANVNLPLGVEAIVLLFGYAP